MIKVGQIRVANPLAFLTLSKLFTRLESAPPQIEVVGEVTGWVYCQR